MKSSTTLQALRPHLLGAADGLVKPKLIKRCPTARCADLRLARALAPPRKFWFYQAISGTLKRRSAWSVGELSHLTLYDRDFIEFCRRESFKTHRSSIHFRRTRKTSFSMKSKYPNDICPDDAVNLVARHRVRYVRGLNYVPDIRYPQISLDFSFDTSKLTTTPSLRISSKTKQREIPTALYR